MAKVKFGSAVAEIRGSVGGTVYSRNAGGAYLRSRTSPVQRNTSLQAAAKSLFGAAVNTFTNALAPSERTAWDSYAESVPYTDVFGATRYYSGQQRYVQCYIAAVNAGNSVAACAIAPTTMTEAEGVSYSQLSATQGAAVADMTLLMTNALAPTDATAGDLLLFYIGKPVTAATKYFKGPYRYAGKAEFVSGTTYPTTLLTDPFARDCAEGSTIPLQWRIVKADNRMSPVSRGILTVGAFVV